MQLTLTDEQARAAWLGLMFGSAGMYESAARNAMAGRPSSELDSAAPAAKSLADEIKRLAPHVAKPLEDQCDS